VKVFGFETFLDATLIYKVVHNSGNDVAFR